ncbi:MAG: alpha/beta fold hydrolase [Candidatus Heimdallarchaeota archaeon]|nr:alpha/beta fold hydrolase [Candidatus Heimdallarchaeota archaeon]
MPTFKVNPEAKAFYFKRGQVGCLLCHGFTGTPKEVRELGNFLSEKDITIYAPRLPGHGTSIDDLKRTCFADWFLEYSKGVDKLVADCQEVFVCGLSLGGILTLKYAVDHPVAGVIAMATPLTFGVLNTFALAIIGGIAKNIVITKSKETLAEMKNHSILCYEQDPIGPANSIRKNLRAIRRNLHRISAPILILQGLHDARWIVNSAKKIHQRVSSRDKELVFLEQSSHNLLMGPEISSVKKIVYAFLKKHSTLL